MNDVAVASTSSENEVKTEGKREREKEKGGRPKKKEKNNKKKEELSDPESETDIGEMERRRDENMKRLIIADYHFQQLKQLLKNSRIKELEKKKELALDHKGDDFTRKKSELDKKHKHKKDFISAMYTLGHDQLNRKKWAQKHMYARDMYSDSRLRVQEKMIEQMESQIREMERHTILSAASIHHVMRTQCDNSEKEVKRVEMRTRKRRHQEALQRPILVSGLDPASLDEDLKHVELMCTLAEIRSEHEMVRDSVFCDEGDIKEERMEF